MFRHRLPSGKKPAIADTGITESKSSISPLTLDVFLLASEILKSVTFLDLQKVLNDYTESKSASPNALSILLVRKEYVEELNQCDDKNRETWKTANQLKEDIKNVILVSFIDYFTETIPSGERELINNSNSSNTDLESIYQIYSVGSSRNLSEYLNYCTKNPEQCQAGLSGILKQLYDKLNTIDTEPNNNPVVNKKL